MERVRASLSMTRGIQVEGFMGQSLEVRFTRFLEESFGAESIDALSSPGPNDPKKADYYLANRRVVAEIKSLDADQLRNGSKIINEYLSGRGLVIFGELSLLGIAGGQDEEKDLNYEIYNKMTNRIKKICGYANKQITEQFKRLPHLAVGVLILINEKNTSMHPRMVADRVSEYVASELRSIHYCLMIFESHKIKVNDQMLPYPLLLDFTRSARQRRSLRLLQSIHWQWAKMYGHLEEVVSDEKNEIAYYPNNLVFYNELY